jgi:hypothetical protein
MKTVKDVIEFIQDSESPDELALIERAARNRKNEIAHNDEFGAGRARPGKPLGVDITANPGRPLK